MSGAAYTGYTVQYGANGKRTSETFSNGLVETWTYNPDGSYQIAYTGVSGAAYTGYTVQYGANGKPTSETFSNGLVETWTYNPDGSYQIAYTGRERRERTPATRCSTARTAKADQRNLQ